MRSLEPLIQYGGSQVKSLLANAGDVRDLGSIPGLGRFPWRRKWQPTPVFLPGESHGQRGSGGLWSMGSQRVRDNWNDIAHSNPEWLMSCHREVKMDGLQKPHGEIYTILTDVVLSHKASPRAYHCVGTHTQRWAGGKHSIRDSDSFWGEPGEPCVRSWLHSSFLGGRGSEFMEVIVHEWSPNEWMGKQAEKQN